jgi:hypothetical protein
MSSNMFMAVSCEICGKFLEHHSRCPRYDETIKSKILVRREEIKWLQIELKYWKLGKYVSGEKIKFLK